MNGKVTPFVIVKESHPFLCSVGMAVDHVWGRGEADPLTGQSCMFGPDVWDAEVKDVGGVARAGFTQHQACAAKIEEGKTWKGVKLAQTQLIAEESAGAVKPFDPSCDLPQSAGKCHADPHRSVSDGPSITPFWRFFTPPALAMIGGLS